MTMPCHFPGSLIQLSTPQKWQWSFTTGELHMELNWGTYVPDGSHGFSHKSRTTTIASLSGFCWITIWLKVIFLDHITTDEILSYLKPEAKWNGYMQIPHQRNCSRFSHHCATCTLFWDKNIVSPRFPGTWKNHQPLHHDFDQAEGPKPENTDTIFCLPCGNARPHTVLRTIDHFENFGWSVLPYILYSHRQSIANFLLLYHYVVILLISGAQT